MATSDEIPRAGIARVISLDVQVCREGQQVCLRLRTTERDFMLALDVEQAVALSDLLDEAVLATEDPR